MTSLIHIRRVLTHVEDIHHEFGPVAAKPLRRGAIAAVLTNPFAGRYEPEGLRSPGGERKLEDRQGMLRSSLATGFV